MINKFINETFKDLDFTLYHITSATFISLLILLYTIFFSFEPSFIINKDKYYLKHSKFDWNNGNNSTFKNVDRSLLSINSEGKKRIMLFSFIFSVFLTLIIHVLVLYFI